MLAAFVGLDRLREPGRFGSWLYAIAANLARMRLRRPSPPVVHAVPAPPADETLERNERASLVRAALGDARRARPRGAGAPLLRRARVPGDRRGARPLPGRRPRAAAPRAGSAPRRARTAARRGGSRDDRADHRPRDREDDRDRGAGRAAPRRAPARAGRRARAADLDRSSGGGGARVRARRRDAAAPAPPRPHPAAARGRRGARGARHDQPPGREDVLRRRHRRRRGSGTSELDARPSDALNLAARVGAPSSSREELLDAGGYRAAETFDAELDETVARALGGPRRGEWKPLSAADVRAAWEARMPK